MSHNEKPLIFISHAEEDEPIATALANVIEKACSGAVRCWFSSDKRARGGVSPGKKGYAYIDDHLRSAEYVFVLVSPSSIDRPWIYWEGGVGAAVCPGGVVPISFGYEFSELGPPLALSYGINGLDSDDLCTKLGKIGHDLGLEPDTANLRKHSKSFVNKVKPHVEKPRGEEAVLADRGLVTKEDIKQLEARLEDKLRALVGPKYTPSDFHKATEVAQPDPEAQAVAKQAVILERAGAKLETELLRALAERLYESGNLDEAVVVQRYVVGTDKGADADRVNLGILLHRTGRVEEAEQIFRSGLDIRPDYAGYWVGIGRVCTETQRNEEAEKAYRRAVELDPAKHVGWCDLGTLLRKTGRSEEAKDAYRKAIELNLACPSAWYGLGRVLSATGRSDEAEDAYRKTIEIEPNDSLSWYRLAELLSETTRSDDAEHAYRKAIEIKPDISITWCGLGKFLSAYGRDEEAENAYRKAIDLDPTNSGAWCRLGDLLLGIGRPEEAEDAFGRALDGSECAKLRLKLADVYRETGRTCEAASTVNKVAEGNPKDPDLLNEVAYRLLELGHLDRAEEQARKALRINPDHSYASATLGLIYFVKDDLAEGRRLYERAVKLSPDESALRQKFHFEYGRALARNQRQAEARRQFYAARMLDSDFIPRAQIDEEIAKLDKRVH